MQQINAYEAELMGIKTHHTIMDNGEKRFRLIADDGSGYVRVESGQSFGWQNAHYHNSFNELCIVQKGKAIVVLEEGKGYSVSVLSPGDFVIFAKGTGHNTYLFSNSVTHTIKYGNIESDDWVSSPKLDAYCEFLNIENVKPSEAIEGNGLLTQRVPESTPDK